MNGFNELGNERRDGTNPAVIWTTYELDGYVHAVADVPRAFPKSKLGFTATDAAATVFLGDPAGPHWTVPLPVSVNPTPVAVSYNNGVFEVVFSEATADPLDAIGDFSPETA